MSVCRGRISLVHVLGATPAAGKRSGLTLGTRMFTIAAGKRVALTVRLSARGRRLLERGGTLRIRVTVAWREPGRVRTTVLPTKLKAAAAPIRAVQPAPVQGIPASWVGWPALAAYVILFRMWK